MKAYPVLTQPLIPDIRTHMDAVREMLSVGQSNVIIRSLLPIIQGCEYTESQWNKPQLGKATYSLLLEGVYKDTDDSEAKDLMVSIQVDSSTNLVELLKCSVDSKFVLVSDYVSNNCTSNGFEVSDLTTVLKGELYVNRPVTNAEPIPMKIREHKKKLVFPEAMNLMKLVCNCKGVIETPETEGVPAMAKIKIAACWVHVLQSDALRKQWLILTNGEYSPAELLSVKDKHVYCIDTNYDNRIVREYGKVDVEDVIGMIEDFTIRRQCGVEKSNPLLKAAQSGYHN